MRLTSLSTMPPPDQRILWRSCLCLRPPAVDGFGEFGVLLVLLLACKIRELDAEWPCRFAAATRGCPAPVTPDWSDVPRHGNRKRGLYRGLSADAIGRAAMWFSASVGTCRLIVPSETSNRRDAAFPVRANPFLWSRRARIRGGPLPVECRTHIPSSLRSWRRRARSHSRTGPVRRDPKELRFAIAPGICARRHDR